MRRVFVSSFVLLGASISQAFLVNGSFEDPPLNPGAFSSSGINGWSVATNGASGVWNIPSSTFITIEAPHGDQIGYTNGTSIAQVSSAVLSVGANTLTGYGIRRGDGFAGSFILRLYAGGTVSNGAVTGGDFLGGAVYDHTTQAPHSAQAISFTYNANGNHPSLGQALVVEIVKTAGSQADFDDIRINGVPEPATFTVLGLGLAAIAKRRRR